MDKAPDYESGDSRFKSWQGRFCILIFKTCTFICQYFCSKWNVLIDTGIYLNLFSSQPTIKPACIRYTHLFKLKIEVIIVLGLQHLILADYVYSSFVTYFPFFIKCIQYHKECVDKLLQLLLVPLLDNYHLYA